MNSKSLAYCNETSGINISVLLNILRDEKLQSQIIYEIENLFSPYLNNQKIEHSFKIKDLTFHVSPLTYRDMNLVSLETFGY